MSIDAIRYVESVRGLKAVDRCVLWELAYHHNAVRAAAWPSVDLLAAKLNLSVRRLYRILNHLEELGHIARIRGRGRGQTSAYSFPRVQLKTCEEPNGKTVERCGRKPKRVTPETRKGDILDTAIRKEHVLNMKIKSREAAAAGSSQCKTSNQNQDQPQEQPQTRVDQERTRRLALSESRRLGIRDFSRYPLEAWEGPLQSWEIQKRKQMQTIADRSGFRSITKSDLRKAAGLSITAKSCERLPAFAPSRPRPPNT